jgi:hypothetical protein
MRLSLERPRRGMSPAMVLVAAALLLLLGIATATVGAEIVRRLEDPRLAVVPVPSGAPSPDATAVVPETWTLYSVGATSGIPFPATAVAGAEGNWVAVGGMSCVPVDELTYNCEAVIARSGDGRTWESVMPGVPIASRYSPPSSGPSAGMSDVAAGPDGFVAVGFGSVAGGRSVEGTAWWSADGVTWEAVGLGDGARPTAAFRAPDRWLIGGVVYGDERPVAAIWTSVDGRTWTLIEDAATFDVGGYVDTMEDPASGGIRAFAWNGPTLVAGGQVCAEGGRPCAAAAWTSSDGTAWERVSQVPAADRISEVVSANGPFVAVAERCVDSACKAVVFRSEDGRAWSEVPMDLPETAQIGSNGKTIVLVTGEYRSLDVRASADGVAWTVLGSVAAPERVNWGSPVLVIRPEDVGAIDLLIRSDPVDLQESEADVWTALWEIWTNR